MKINILDEGELEDLKSGIFESSQIHLHVRRLVYNKEVMLWKTVEVRSSRNGDQEIKKVHQIPLVAHGNVLKMQKAHNR